MTNEVQINVTGRETAGPALDAVRAKSKALGDTVKATGTSLKDSATAATAAAAATDKAAQANAKAIGQAKALDAQITELRGSLRELAGEYAENQDKDVLARIKAQQATLREQVSVRKLLPALVAEAADVGATVGETLAKKVGDGVGKAAGVGETLGTEIGTKAGPALVASLGTKVAAAGGPLGAVGAAIAIPIAAEAATVLGAAIGAGITGGVGIGGVIGGVTVATRHASVKSAVEGLGHEFESRLERAAVSFVPATLSGISVIRNKFAESADDLEAIFSKSSKFVVPLASGAGDGLQDIVAGARALVDVADPAIDSISEGLAEIGSAARSGMESLTDNAESGARALALVFEVVEFGVSSIFSLINVFAELYEVMEIGNGLFELFSQGSDKGGEASEEFKTNLANLMAGFEETSTAAEDAAEANRVYADSLDRIVDQNLSAAEAAIRYRDGLKEAKAAADDKKSVSDAELEQLVNLARGANTYTDSLEQQGASTRRLSGHQKNAREDFIATAREMGYSKERAAELADQYLKIPRKVPTEVTADTDQAARNLRYIRDLYAQIKSKRVVITTFNNTIVTRSEGRNVGIGDGIGGRAHGGITGAAAGGIRGDLTWVGERGPELLDLPPGTMVHPAGTSKQMLMAGGGGAPTYVTVQAGYIVTPQQLEDHLVEVMGRLSAQGRV